MGDSALPHDPKPARARTGPGTALENPAETRSLGVVEPRPVGGSRPIDDAVPLAEAKLAAPRQRGGTVERVRIALAIRAGADAALTLVAAPAGYGKTTAVSAWCVTSQATSAWVTLDSGDDDPVRLWTYVATAVNRIREGLGRRALRRLDASGVSVDAVIDELMNGIADYGREVALVLDDFQTVTHPACLRSLRYAIRRLPANARLIVITRAEPELGLAHLRARGALVEVRADKLAFTFDEARELLVERAGLELGDEDIDLLHQRTEGWPATLYLAALWLRTIRDPHQALRDFGGDHRYIADYFRQEVLASLTDDKRSFLLQAAVLARFTAELCDGVLGRSDSSAVLAELEDSNLFVLPLERRQWFRVHSLFSDFATALLEHDFVLGIHRRAAEWLSERGMFVEAIEHAAKAGDHETVAELLSSYHLALIRSGRAATLLQWARTLPDDSLVQRPELTVATATAAVMLGGLTLERRRLLHLAHRAKENRSPRFTAYAEAEMATVQTAAIDTSVTEAVAEGRRAVELSVKAAEDVLVSALASLSRALYFAGDLEEAWMAASRAVTHPDAIRQAPGYALAQATLALVAIDRGQLSSARAHAENARAVVGRITGSRTWLGANAAVAMGAVLAGEGDLAGAERAFARAERSFREEVATIYHTRTVIHLAKVRCERGRLDEADATLRQAREEMAELADSGAVPQVADEVESEIGRARQAASCDERVELPSDAELTVLRLLPTELTTREIAERLFLSPNTVQSHTRAIYRKLGVRSRTEAVARAGALDLIVMPSRPDG